LNRQTTDAASGIDARATATNRFEQDADYSAEAALLIRLTERDVAADMTDYYSRRHRSVAQPG
jgi:hypothetical protein